MIERTLRGIAAASLWAARRARSLRARVGERREGAEGPGAAQARPEDAAFLGQVSEALRRIDSGEAAGASLPHPGPSSARLAAAVTWLRRWRGRVRRHEDALLAVALLVGILVMVIHWRLSGAGHALWQGSHGARGAEAQVVRPASPEEAQPPGVTAAPAARMGPAGDARFGLPR